MAKITIKNNPALSGLIDLQANIVFAAPGGEELALQLLSGDQPALFSHFKENSVRFRVI